jgi:hypothetical protein
MLILTAAFAASAMAFDTYRLGSRVIGVGDSVSSLVELAGQPIHKEPVETSDGGFVGELWQYRVGRKAVTFTIRAGRITQIDETRN